MISKPKNLLPLLDVIHDFSVQFSGSGNIDETAKLVLDYLFTFTGCQIAGLLFRPKSEDNHWQFIATTRKKAGQSAVRELKNRALDLIQATSGEQIRQYDLSISLKGTNWDWVPHPDEQPPRVLATLPVSVGGRIGAVAVLGKFDGDGFASDELARANFGMDRFGLMLDNFRLQQKIDDEKSQLELMIDNLNEGLLVIDDAGRIRGVNRALEHILDIRSEDMVGLDIFDTRTESDFPNLVRICRAATPANFLPCWEHRELCDRQCSDCRVYTEGDKRCWLYYKTNGEIRRNCLQCIVREYNVDIYGALKQFKTEINLSEPVPKDLVVTTTIFKNQRGNYTGELKVVRDVTSEKQIEVMKDDFIATTSHELKTPLFSMRGFTQLLLADPEMPLDQRLEFLHRIDSESQRLKKLVDSILLVSAAEGGKIRVKPGPFSPEDIIKSAMQHTEMAAREKNVTVTYEIADKGLVITADEDKIDHCLTNLVDNAIKFNREGGAVRIKVDSDERQVRFQVRDQGAGIAPEDSGKLFQRFSRIESPNRDRPPGTGLGLYLCRRMIEAHGGKIWIESVPGEGSSFIFTLPLKSDGSDAP